MAQTNYYISGTTNSAGESEINLRLYVSRDIRLRIGSGIWIDRKRWGKKNDINIPLIQGEERERLLEKRSKLKALTDLLEQEINTAPDKSAITRAYLQSLIKRFHKPTKAKKAHEKSFFDVIDIYLAAHKLSENRLKNFRVLVRCLHRFELYRKATAGRGFTLSFTSLTPIYCDRSKSFCSVSRRYSCNIRRFTSNIPILPRWLSKHPSANGLQDSMPRAMKCRKGCRCLAVRIPFRTC